MLRSRALTERRSLHEQAQPILCAQFFLLEDTCSFLFRGGQVRAAAQQLELTLQALVGFT